MSDKKSVIKYKIPSEVIPLPIENLPEGYLTYWPCESTAEKLLMWDGKQWLELVLAEEVTK